MNFSGPQLREKVVGILEAENAHQYQLFQEWVNRIMETEIIPLLTDKIANNDELITTIEDAYLYFLREATTGYANAAGKSISRARNPYTAVQGLFQNGRVITEAMTRNQRQRWEEILGLKTGSKGKNGRLPTISLSQNTISFNWFSNTHKWTQSDIKERIESSDSQVRARARKILDKVNKTTTDYLLTLVDSGSREDMQTIINYILQDNNDPYAFFVGENTQDIVGILGEIQSIFYLYKFLGSNPSTLGTRIKWQGGLHISTSGQKPHIDVLLDDLYGIQVKNTTKIALEDITFANASVETVLNKLDINDDLRRLVENYYGTLYFNVGWNINAQGDYYHNQAHPWNGNGRAQEYLDTYKDLENMEDQIQKLLAFSAAALMYMGIRDAANGLDVNSIYLVGGAAVYVASTILETIYERIDNVEQLSNTFHIHMGRSKIDKTIVEALNEMKNSASAANKRSLVGTSNSFSSQILKKTILTSSFNFGSLEIK